MENIQLNFDRESITEQKSLNHGDHIVVEGDLKDLNENLYFLMMIVDRGEHLKYYHHGIYDKKSLKVIHFTGVSKEDAVPIKTEYSTFKGDRPIYRVVYGEGDLKCLEVSETMKMAEDAVEQGKKYKQYHILQNNCETFATRLKTGEAVSQQVKEALQKIFQFVEKQGPGLAQAAYGSSAGVSGWLAGSSGSK